MHNLLEPQRIEEILRHTMEVLQESKHQMFDIVETAQIEYNRIAVAIIELKKIFMIQLSGLRHWKEILGELESG